MKVNTQKIKDDFFHIELRKAIRLKSEKRMVEFHECVALSEQFSMLGIPISAHTLARFFGVLETKHRPYTSTLDLLSQYIGHNSFTKFCSALSENLDSALFSPKDTFSTGAYSLVAFELAIAENDWKTMNDLLESVHLNDPFTYELVMYLGSAVRRHPNKKDFLNALSQSKSGRWFFYECFVDEDDENNYYSDALLAYYAKSPIPAGNQIFIKCFLAVKSIYAGKSIRAEDFGWIQMESISLDQLHFHEISRVLELRILIDHVNKQLTHSLITHLDLVCEISSKMAHFDACWILARTIKALSFSGVYRAALSYSTFADTVIKRFHENPTRIHSIGELILQCAGHNYYLHVKNERFNFPPTKLSFRHDNETKSRILVESATALMYAEEPVKTMLKKNLHAYSVNTHQTWINALILG
ncbi:MAG: hypothetical protein RL632_1654 [Bacteroidota bacterium]|jgi:hypothetical protein